MARVIRKETRLRGLFGWVFLLAFFGFNALMLAWLVLYLGVVDQAAIDNDTAAAKRTFSVAVGIGMILIVWTAGVALFGVVASMAARRLSKKSQPVGQK